MKAGGSERRQRRCRQLPAPAESLRLQGHEVWAACDGDEALAKALELRPDVPLLDLGMPRIVCIEVAKRIRAIPTVRDMALVALTESGQPVD